MRQIGFEHHLERWNQSHQAYPNDNLIQLFEKKAVEFSNTTACIYQDKHITYGELNKRANQLAHFILKQDKTNSPIAIYIDRSIDVVVSFLAVLKTGRPYIPIAVDAPSIQLRNMIEDAHASIMLTTLEYVKKINDTTDILAIIDVNQELIFQEEETNLPPFSATNLAYILYTSGTTGKPKGVQIAHRSLVNLLFAMRKELQIKENKEVFLGITPFTFDLSVPDIYLSLIFGGQIVIAASMTRYNPREIRDLLCKFNVSIMQATPTTWQMLVNNGWKNETDIKIVTGGEALTNQLASNLLVLSNTIWNFYGPTETTVWSTSHRLTTVNKNLPYIPIGKPLANTRIYILDKKRQPVAVDTPGELYIGGDGVSPGYLNNDTLNQHSFITTPFSVGKLYKTGDMVKWSFAGELEYLGRLDTQIKLNGHRIEVEAIENILQEFPNIAQCIVHDKTPEGKRELSAYIIVKLKHPVFTVDQLQNYLRQHFPNYMIPSQFFVVDKFPLTANGKINRKRMASVSNYQELVENASSQHHTSIEKIIHGIIQKILNQDTVHPERNFFNLGMNSLLLVELAEHLSNTFKQNISIVDVFAYPTVRLLANFLYELNSNHKREDDSQKLERIKIADDIALIGMSCKFPGANNPREFWNSILHKMENIRFFDAHELQQAGVRLNMIEHPDYVPARGVIEGIDQFDASFFGYSPAEARLMDPQHRLFLETAWAALEDSGYVAETYSGNVGLFAGMSDSTYLLQNTLKNSTILAEYDQQQLMLANSSHYLCTRVAYALGLKGPAITVNTACSTSLVAIAIACDSLQNHHCDMALAGGITLTVPDTSGYLYRDFGILSQDGHCRVFDKEAKGTVMSNGCGIVVLKRLVDAKKANDNILAVIKGWAVNNDGEKKAGFTAPSVSGQVACIQEALNKAQISADQIGYIEAHGTGTILGDPIEITALAKGYANHFSKNNNVCALGSVKANIGHTDVASGVAGFIKLALAVHENILPPQINFSLANDKMNLTETPFFINTEIRPWINNSKRTGAINSLGFGGTNAHIIVEEPPMVETTSAELNNVFLCSAKTPISLDAIKSKLLAFLMTRMEDAEREKLLADMVYTLQIGRKHFQKRIAIVYSGYEDLVKKLSIPCSSFSPAGGIGGRVIFGFSDPGTQYINMALDLYQKQPVFKELVDDGLEIATNLLKLDLRELLFPNSENSDEANKKLQQSPFQQTALFIIEYALARFLMYLGINPDATIAHGLGKYVAETISGVVSLHENLQIIIKQANAISKTKSDELMIVLQNLNLSRNDFIIQVGPGTNLLQWLSQLSTDEVPQLISTLPSVEEGEQSYSYFLNALGALWLLEKEIHWQRLYGNQIRKRISLPTYEFDRQSYWLNPDFVLTKEEYKKDIQGFYTPIWKQDLRSDTYKPLDNSPKTWLIFTNQINSPLEAYLKGAGHSCYIIQSGSDFTELAANSFIINPAIKSHYERILQALKFQGEHCHVIHSWLLDEELTRNETDAIFTHGAGSLLYLSQAMSEFHPQTEMNFLALCSNLYSVFGDESIIPAKAAILGPVKVIPLEQDNLVCKAIDLESNSMMDEVLASRMIQEAIGMHREDTKQEIAYRRGKRWIRLLEPCTAYIEANRKSRLKTQGVYLITGGLGGLGLVFAQYLAEHYQAHLILVSKTSIDLKAEQSHSKKHEQQLNSLKRIVETAQSLRVEEAHVEDEAEMQRVLRETLTRFGRIDGVIHAAGVAGDGITQLKTVEEYQRVLKPKLQGTETLLKLLKKEPVDFIVFISSITSILGYPGQVDYCSANRILDAYAHSNLFHPATFCVAMNWQAWRDIGMAAESRSKLFQLDETNSNTNEEGLVLFEKILQSDLHQVLISKSDPNRVHVKLEPVTKRERDIHKDESNLDIDVVTNIVLNIWREVLGIPNVHLDDDFYELGGHSLLAISLLAKLKNQFHIKIPASILFKAKTVRSFSEAIQSYTQQEYSPLIMLKEGKATKPPLFLIHPIGGTVFCYLPLVESLDNDRSYYGLQDPSFELEKPLFTCLEDMAAFYLKAIKKVQAEGPYYLCGASFGATVVTEIAHQLLVQNEKVQFVGLLDGWATFSNAQHDINYAETLSLHSQSMDGSKDNIPSGIDNPILWESMLRHRLRLMSAYSIKKLDTKLVLFKAIDILQEYRAMNVADNHWGFYSANPIECHTVPGDHNSMLQRPHVEVLAERIQDYLRTEEVSLPIDFNLKYSANLTTETKQ